MSDVADPGHLPERDHKGEGGEAEREPSVPAGPSRRGEGYHYDDHPRVELPDVVERRLLAGDVVLVTSIRYSVTQA